MTRSPRCLNTYKNVTFCNGWGAGVFVPFLFAFIYKRIIAGLKRLVFYFPEIVKTWAAFTPLFVCLFEELQGQGMV
jgi:hypothetical protein